jgi:hypothetical protein
VATQVLNKIAVLALITLPGANTRDFVEFDESCVFPRDGRLSGQAKILYRLGAAPFLPARSALILNQASEDSPAGSALL